MRDTRLKPLPHLSCAQAPLTQAVQALDQHGRWIDLAIPAERALTVYVDKQELVTLMTLGQHPEWLVLGYLLNQRLLPSVHSIASVSVDWDTQSAGVYSVGGIDDWQHKTATRVVTTGCGQGSMFGDVMNDVASLTLPDTVLTQDELLSMVNTIRLQDSVYKTAGSVHGCGLFRGGKLLKFVEDVGRHNAIDTIAGWMAMHQHSAELDLRNQGLAFYTTGRLTSEMIIKAAQMGIAVVVSRSGITQMGLAVASQLGLCAIGRATHNRLLCFSAPQRLTLNPGAHD